MLQTREITDAEYIAEFQPVGVWILIEKDLLPHKTAGGIIIPGSKINQDIKLSGTGVIKRMPPSEWATFEQHHDHYWNSLFREGDRVCFSSTTPIIAPAPPQWKFQTGDDNSIKFVQIMISDITAIILSSEEERANFKARFNQQRQTEAY